MQGWNRAIGTRILLSKKIEQKDIHEFNKLIVKQNVYNKLFMKYAPDRFTRISIKKF